MRHGRLYLGILALLALDGDRQHRARRWSARSRPISTRGAIPAGDEIWFSAVMKPGGSFDKTQTATSS